MENFGTIALLLLIGWQVMAVRKGVDSLTYRTTVFYLIESEERSASGIAEGSVILSKKFDLPIAITPGMEFAGIANNKPTLVARVVFDTEDRGVHLKSGLMPLQELEDTKKWYVSRGWSSEN
jgi:hypothetical protein